jgi:hypothetical protein
MLIGRVFERAFDTIRHNPVVTLGIALVLGTLPNLLLTYAGAALRILQPRLPGSAFTMAVWEGMLFSIVTGMAISAIVEGALIRATVAENDGRRSTFGECMTTGLQVFLPLIAIGVVSSLGVMVGIILLIVPGIIFALMWSVATPSFVVERDGVFASLRRSAELTKGSRWKILGLFLIVGVVYWAISLLIGFAGIAVYNPSSVNAGLTIANVIASLVVLTVFNAIWGTVQASLYIELREQKEGTSLGNLEQVFA